MSPARPNILLVHWHDLGRHLGTYGMDSVPSPAVDALAGEGIRFDRAFCTTPLCSPARGALFTGRYPHSNGLIGLTHLGWNYHPGERTLPMLLGEHGYRSALFGMQHEDPDLRRLGYDETHATTAPTFSGPVTEAATSWLAAQQGADRPFLAVVGFDEVHRPYPTDRFPPDDPATVDVPAWLPDNEWTRDDLASYQGCIRVADAAVGRLLAGLESAGLADDTWVIFTTDHGMAFPRGKSTLYDSGIGVSLIMRPPAGWRSAGAAAGPVDQLVSHVDLVPTILDALELPVPAAVQGVSHAALVHGRSEPPARTEIFAEKNFHDHYDPIRAVRTEQYKYVVNAEQRPALVFPQDIETSPTRYGLDPNDACLRPRAAEELYDVVADPAEQANLAADPAYADIKADLAARLLRWQQGTDDPLLAGPIPGRTRPRRAQYGALVTD